MKNRSCILAFGVGFLFLLSCNPPPNSDNHLLKEDQEILNDLRNLPAEFTCRNTVDIVNHLRSLGKSRALHVLQKYDPGPDQPPSVSLNTALFCSLLFQFGPEGRPGFLAGAIVPAVDQGAIKLFPLFPLALSNGVPFMLIMGTNLGGSAPDAGQTMLDACAKLDMMRSALPISGFATAAKKIIDSDEFRALYPDPKARGLMEENIYRQANNVEE